jgi:hypothetical protein
LAPFKTKNYADRHSFVTSLLEDLRTFLTLLELSRQQVLSYDEMRKSPVVNSGDAVRMILYLNGKNLTNTPLKYTEGQPGRPIQRETYGQTWQFGVEGTF